MICKFVERILKHEHSMWLWALGTLLAFMAIALGMSVALDWLLS